jgi:hypothetical protein
MDPSQDLNSILQGMDAETTTQNPVVYPAGPPHLMNVGAPILASVTLPTLPIQVDIPRLIGGVFQRIDALQAMLLQRIEALEARLVALEKRLPN